MRLKETLRISNRSELEALAELRLKISQLKAQIDIEEDASEKARLEKDLRGREVEETAKKR